MNKVHESSHLQRPKYIINLSLPPVERYKHVARDFKPELASLAQLFDEIVQGLRPRLPVKVIHFLARLFLRRVHDHEETEELRGIQQVTGLEMHLLVAFNVLLDLLMGCTSGGIQISDGSATKMLHFRTLDWGMDPLRKVVVHFDFVQNPGGKIIASAMTYVGFVGLLTGVKPGLSISLNFRPNHSAITRFANFRFYFHHLLVLFGFQPSVSSLLRQILLPSLYSSPVGGPSGTLDSIERSLHRTKSTAAYLIFCDGNRTMTVEKDFDTALVKSSDRFIVICNHDESFETSPESTTEDKNSSNALKITGMEDLVAESISRKETMVSLFQRSSTNQKRGSRTIQDLSLAITAELVCTWMDTYPITNEETHFGVIMDPTLGKIIWTTHFLEPRSESSCRSSCSQRSDNNDDNGE